MMTCFFCTPCVGRGEASLHSSQLRFICVTRKFYPLRIQNLVLVFSNSPTDSLYDPWGSTHCKASKPDNEIHAQHQQHQQHQQLKAGFGISFDPFICGPSCIVELHPPDHTPLSAHPSCTGAPGIAIGFGALLVFPLRQSKQTTVALAVDRSPHKDCQTSNDDDGRYNQSAAGNRHHPYAGGIDTDTAMTRTNSKNK
jgi:hypothetical protein